MGATKTQEKSMVETILSEPYMLILHNDDHNSFDHVINSLIKICEHELEQATQCAYMVHNNGRCDIKYGDKETISEMKSKLVLLGLSVTMEIN